MKRSSLRFSALVFLAAWFCGFSSAAPVAEPATHIVTIENMRFSPATLTVRPGDWVIFKNQGIVPHTVTEKTAKTFDSAILPPGEQWKLVVPARAGAIHYHCTLHPLMEGSLTVDAPPRP
jgi:plastocyanin